VDKKSRHTVHLELFGAIPRLQIAGDSESAEVHVENSAGARASSWCKSTAEDRRDLTVYIKPARKEPLKLELKV